MPSATPLRRLLALGSLAALGALLGMVLGPLVSGSARGLLSLLGIL